MEGGDAMEKVGPLFLKFQYPPDYAIDQWLNYSIIYEGAGRYGER